MFSMIFAAACRMIAKDNNNTALIPEVWSREALMTLMSNTIMAQLVHRDFSNLVASEGDVVNTSRPADFAGKRKTDSDNVTDQDAVSPNIPVPLDQHFHVSYIIKDGERTKALPDLLERYMEPAAREIAEKIDQVLCGQVARLQTHQVGQPGAVSELNIDDYILDADEKLNDNRAPKFGRYLVMSSRANRAALGADIVVEADKRGDSGSALREASVGRIYGFDTFMDQNVAHVSPADTEVVLGVTDGAEAKGSVVIEATNAVANVVTAGGEYITIAGSKFAHRVSSATADTAATDFTLVQGLTDDVLSGAVVTLYRACDVKNAYALGFAKEVILDGFAANKGPQVGQIVTFGVGAASHSYTVIGVTKTTTTEYSLLLDRPLSAELTDNQLAYPGPAGSRSIAFTREAIALVSRPLASVPEGSGAASYVASMDGLSMRVTMQYDSKAQGTRVTFDVLCGVAILDARLAVVING